MPLRELSRQFGMSRTPLRAAASRLHEQGLLAYSARLGFTVALPTAADIYESFDLRLMCETHALGRFFGREAREVSAALTRLAREVRDLSTQITGDVSKYPEFSARDAAFHRTIVTLAESRRLLAWYDQLHLGLFIYRLGWAAPMNEERFRRTADEHAAIAAAIGRGDAERAQRLLTAHIVRIRDQTIERMVLSGSAGGIRGSWIDRLAAP